MSTSAEETILKRSIAMTVLVGASGVAFGILSGSLSIVFDGVFSAVDAAMTGLALLVTRLIAQDTSRRFQMGFWHFEPMVLAFNGALLTLLSFYAFVNAVATILAGGRELVFDWAIVYALLVLAICGVMVVTGRRANRAIGSQFVALDIKGWTMSGAITAALLVAFVVASLLEGTRYAWATPYVDPTILAVLTLCLIPVPLRTVAAALQDVFLVAPAELDRHVAGVAAAAVQRHGFRDAHTYVAKAGRSRLVEVHFILPPDFAIGSVAVLDAIREEVGAAIGGEGRDRWLTIAFTGDAKWAE
jgi:predicted Co/Zn/Cd cation transporter (cation efflux family)